MRSDGAVLWVAGDETATVERLVADDRTPRVGRADDASALADFVDLPGADADEEADIEGLARDGGFLWAVGSHSLRRKRIKDQARRREGARAARQGGGAGQPAGRWCACRSSEVDGAAHPGPRDYS